MYRGAYHGQVATAAAPGTVPPETPATTAARSSGGVAARLAALRTPDDAAAPQSAPAA